MSLPMPAQDYSLPENNACPVHILVVDDDEQFGQMLEAVVAKYAGYACSSAVGAEEALKVLAAGAVDVVITDIKMPGMNGLELTRLIKARYNADVIMITGFFEDFTYEEAIENGANDFIEKPVRPKELIIRLNRVLRERAILNDRRRAEEALQKSEKQYHDIFDRAMEGIFQADPEGKFLTANKALSGMLGYGSPGELMTRVLHIPTQLCAHQQDFAALLQTLINNGSVNRHELQLRTKEGRQIWVEANIMAVKDDAGQILSYEGNVEDISLRKSAEEARKDSLERLRKALNATVQALASTAEVRDPYTAGHQRRVADLARTIATRMGLSAKQIDGIRLASSIHDIGKVSVPAEILIMPRKLTDLEFALIKTHSQTGFDILKDIEFPWPIARMVLEHHERSNGSGYPNRLTGREMLIESRIIAVSDVVEAIASHRPYRPGFGIAAALDEIDKNKGILYDLEVATACRQVFQEDNYQLSA